MTPKTTVTPACGGGMYSRRSGGSSCGQEAGHAHRQDRLRSGRPCVGWPAPAACAPSVSPSQGPPAHHHHCRLCVNNVNVVRLGYEHLHWDKITNLEIFKKVYSVVNCKDHLSFTYFKHPNWQCSNILRSIISVNK